MSRNVYKKKGVGVDPTDKRRLRRSIHQKEVRDHGFLTRRIVDQSGDTEDLNLSPVQEPERPCAVNKTGTKKIGISIAAESSNKTRETKKADPRRDMLKKWQEEKEMKRKIALMKKETKKPGFKVIKVNHEKASYLDVDKRAKKGTTKRAPPAIAATRKPAAVPVVRKSSRLAVPVPVVRRSTRLADKDQPPAPRSKLQQPSTSAGCRGRATRSKPVSAESKAASTTVHPKYANKKTIPKVKEPVFPTIPSFTFRKEITLTLKNAPPANKTVVGKKDRDGAAHYQRVMNEEKKRLTDVCSTWEKISKKETIAEEAGGEVRSAIGKAQLLMNQRFHQFGGLIEQCRLGLGEKRTHTTDLQGFWDMVYFQIEDVDKLFANLSTLKKNNWIQKDKEENPPVMKKKVIKKKPVLKTEKRLGQKNAARERLATIKAAMKQKKIAPAETVVFDAGFFHIESPVKEKEIHCAASSPNPSLPLKRKSLSERRPSLSGKDQGLLRAVLQASRTPKMNSTPSLDVNSSSIFRPQRENSSTTKIVTRLRDLGLSSGKKRRRSERMQSKESEESCEGVIEPESNDLSMYLMPSLPADGLGSEAEEMTNMEPVDQHLGKGTHDEEERRLSGFSVLPTTPSHLSATSQTSSDETSTAGAASAVSPELQCTPRKMAKKCEDVEMLPHEELHVSKEDSEGAVHYQGVMDAERERLTGICNVWNQVIENEKLPEEAGGEVRSAIGKAQLLMNQRFHQFGGLIEQCRLGLGEKRTHTTDLQGFWDMVYLQIEDVGQLFAVLSELKENGWIAKEKAEPIVKKIIKKKKVTGKVKRSAADNKAAKARLQAAKAAMKAMQTKQTDKVVFDAGFFKVESPAKGNETQQIAGTSPQGSPLLRKFLPPTHDPMARKSRTPTAMVRRSSSTNSLTRTPLAKKDQDLLRAVLWASHTPNMNSISSPINAGSIFTPEDKEIATSSIEQDIVTRLHDLGLNSIGSSNRKRGRSRRRKSVKEEVKMEDLEKENLNDFSLYLMPSLPVVDLNSQAEEMIRTEPADQLVDLVKRTPLADRNDKPTEMDGFVKPPLIPYNPSPAGSDLFDSPRRSTRLRAGRISAFSPPRRSFANVPPSMDLMSFD